ncbi:MAG: acetolactate decarboxylase [Chloroflexi bacterium]|nr:acetolactate decarboxylase [Chloroflexota bacterium]
MTRTRSALLAYNTVDRLLRGDLFHTVTTADVIEDLADYPADYPIIGIGTTSWLRRNGEVIVEGTPQLPALLWADPEGKDVGEILDLCRQHPSATGTPLITPRVDDDDEQANFPFLAITVCDPAQVLHWDAIDIPAGNTHEWLIAELTTRNVGVAGVHIEGRFGVVETTDAYNVPLGGVDLSHGYKNEDVFRFARYEADTWVMKGIFAANPSLQPFISVTGKPLHLHGYRREAREGGHIVSAQIVSVSVTVYPVDDLILRIHDVAQAKMPQKLS